MGIPISLLDELNILLGIFQSQEISYHFTFKRFSHFRGIDHFIAISKFKANVLSFIIEFDNLTHGVILIIDKEGGLEVLRDQDRETGEGSQGTFDAI